MLGFKFVTSRALDYLKAQNRIANKNLSDCQAEIKALKARLTKEIKRGDNLKAELVLYKTAIPNIKHLAIIGKIIVCVLDNSGASYRKAVSLLGQWWRDNDKPTRS